MVPLELTIEVRDVVGRKEGAKQQRDVRDKPATRIVIFGDAVGLTADQKLGEGSGDADDCGGVPGEKGEVQG